MFLFFYEKLNLGYKYTTTVEISLYTAASAVGQAAAPLAATGNVQYVQKTRKSCSEIG